MLSSIFQSVTAIARPAQAPGAIRRSSVNRQRGIAVGAVLAALAAAGVIGLALRPAPVAAPAEAPAVKQEPRVIDIADYRDYMADDHPVRQGMRKFAELAEAASGGTLKVKVRTDALPGPEGRQLAEFKAGTNGAPALMLVAAPGLARLASEYELLDLPYLVASPEQADQLLDGEFGEDMLKLLRPNNLVGLAWWENGFRHISTSGKPIRSVADLKGLKMRVIQGEVFSETARAFGAEPTLLPFSELYQALKAKTVIAEDNSYSQMLAGRLQEVQSSITVTNHSYSAMVLAANEKVWNSLTAEQQQVLRKAAREAGMYQRHASRMESEQARARLVNYGMQIYTLSPDQLQLLRDSSKPLRQRIFARHPDDILQSYLRTLGTQQGAGSH